MSTTPPIASISRASTTGTTSSYYLPSRISNFLRRLSSDSHPHSLSSPSLSHAATFPSPAPADDMVSSAVFTPPHRAASPFQPPPLYPLILTGYHENTAPSARLLSKGIAEEIRLLVPPRLQLCEEWGLVYSLEQDGVSLGTMYKKCEELRGRRNGYVLVVKDGDGGLFGAYLSEAPHVSAHYFGTGECFLWRASVFSPTNTSHLPPPPSTDTTHAQRHTTISSSSSSSSTPPSHSPSPNPSSTLAPPTAPPTRSASPSNIRFKAFPYSGVNDYIMLCEPGFFSVGGGDGRYGLWLDDRFEKGISSTCLTFGNEPLSEEGEKFEILGVELWGVGNLI